MREIKVDYHRQPPAPRPAPRQEPRRSPAQPNQREGSGRNPAPHCAKHPGVHMVLAGSNPARNTIRYLCPMCNAMGLPLVEMAVGVVSKWNAGQGYGFIDNGGPRIFFHISDVEGGATPYEGLPVICRVEQNDRGLIGRQVRAR
jgi:cold shock CspA family protein